MRLRRRHVLVAIAGLTGAAATVLAIAVLGRGTSAAPAPPSDDGKAAAGVPAPRLAGTDLVTGEPIALADLDGKPVVINVWASWCRGCEAEARELKRFADAHPEAAILGLVVGDTVADAKAFYRRFQWTHPILFDPEGERAARLGLTELPTTLFLNPEHVVVGRVVGAGTFDAFENALAEARA